VVAPPPPPVAAATKSPKPKRKALRAGTAAGKEKRPQPKQRHRTDRVERVPVKASAPLTLENNRSTLGWQLIPFLALALALLAAAFVPVTSLPQPVARALTARRADIGLAGFAIAVGVGLSVVLLVLLR
jgi:hypothetical protein